ncbi:hypothetical protein BU23DRAFT_293744 [Bimuria novae-zelandiae CBS 107.79]|uniref:Carbonic anhydrase n=1 Tax=Bimuria novae-zelandiae CBS 107.79 TaxID=1447943 RepID=A0A6A5VJA4_9PLEO|nr:hypothetical protein BU23DRAFT_293744 [Bimuria novae-zelandiae CBS 107.79]
MPSGTLVIIACSEPDTRIDPSRFFNLNSSGNTRVVKTAGGRAGTTINELNAIDRATSIGMIVVLQHIGCAWSPGDTEANIRSDVSTINNSPHIRNDIPIIGYSLDAITGRLKEVNIQDEAARQQVLQEFHDFAPFWG